MKYKVDYDKVAAIETMINKCLLAKEHNQCYYMCWSLRRWNRDHEYNSLVELGIIRDDGENMLNGGAWYRSSDYENRLAHLHFALFRLLGIVK